MDALVCEATQKAAESHGSSRNWGVVFGCVDNDNGIVRRLCLPEKDVDG